VCYSADTGSLYTYTKVEGDSNTSETYYNSWYSVNERMEDLQNSLVLAWNGSSWNQYLYGDFVAGQFTNGVSYTNYLGNTATSNGPQFTSVIGGTSETSGPVNMSFVDNGDNVVLNTNACTSPITLDHSRYHIISTYVAAYSGTSTEELLPDYIDILPGAHYLGNQDLYVTGDTSTWSGSSLYYNTFGNNRLTFNSDNTYSNPFNNILGNHYSVTGTSTMQPLRYYFQSQDGGNTLDQNVPPYYRIEEGTIPTLLDFQGSYPSGKGSTGINFTYDGKENGVPYYKATNTWDWVTMERTQYIRWDGTQWILYFNGGSGAGSTNVNDPSGTYTGTIGFTVTITV
jgi:hypothetical protein